MDITSFNGVAIVAGTIRAAYWDGDEPSPLNSAGRIAPIFATIPGKGDVDVRGQPVSDHWLATVELSPTNQADIDALAAVFNERLGLQYLRCTDGNGKLWRVYARLEGPYRRVSAAQFKIPLFIPNTLWEEDAATTNSQLAKTASPVNFTLTNAGSRPSRPLITITANAAKSINSAIGDYTAAFEGFLVNRSPKEINKKPVALFDVSGAQSRLSTDTSAAGTTVQKTTGNTTLNGALTAAATTIPVANAAGFNPNGGLAVINWVTGVVFGTMECISYAGVSGNSLTGCVRGLGGTSAQAHNNLDRIDLCGTMPNGDDCRVWLDDVPDCARWLTGWNIAGASADVWINVNLQAASTYTLVAAMTAALPANGGSFTVNEDISRLAQRGFFVIGDEVIYYDSRAGRTFFGIQRAQWRTTAAIHAIGANVWANPKHFVVACGFATATPPPAPLAQRPCIQLNGSSNQTWKWGDESDDVSTIYYDVNYPDRSAQWVPGFDLDGNTVSAQMSASITKASLQFKDDVPGDGAPVVNYFELAVPMGIKQSDVNAIKNDWTPANEILNLELFTRDPGGTLKLIDQLQQSAAAAARPLPATLAATAYGVKLKGRYNVVTGDYVATPDAFLQVANTVSSPSAQFNLALKFTLSQSTRVSGISVGLAAVGGDTAVRMQLYRDDGAAFGKPDTANANSVGDASPQMTVTVSGAGRKKYRMLFGGAIVLPAGVYWIDIWRNTFTSLINPCRSGAGRYQPSATGNARNSTGSGWQNPVSPGGIQMWDFAVEGTYDTSGNAVIQNDQPLVKDTDGTRVGITASFDKTAIIIEPSQSIYVHRVGAFGTTLEHISGVLTNTTTGDSITYDAWLFPNSTLAVNCDERTVTKNEAAVAYPVSKCVTFSDTADPMALAAGPNALSYVDAGLIAPASINLVSVFRGVKE